MTAPSHVRAPRPFNVSLPQHESLVHMLLAAVEAQPDHPAVIFEQQRITYAELGRAAAGLANRLESAGVKRGERVILLMANSIEMERRSLPWAGESPEQYVDFLERHAPMQTAAKEAMPPELYAQMRADFVEMARGWAGGDGPFSVDAEYLVIVARKRG